MKFNRLIFLFFAYLMIFTLKPNAGVDQIRYKAALNQITQEYLSYLSPISISDEDVQQHTCPICFETNRHSRDELASLSCKHTFGKECIMTWIIDKLNCPTCRGLLKKRIVWHHDITPYDRRLIKLLTEGQSIENPEDPAYRSGLPQLKNEIRELILDHNLIVDYDQKTTDNLRALRNLNFRNFTSELRQMPLRTVISVAQIILIQIIYKVRFFLELDIRLLSGILNTILQNEIVRDLIISILLIVIVLFPEGYAFDTSRTFRVLLVLAFSKIFYDRDRQVAE